MNYMMASSGKQSLPLLFTQKLQHLGTIILLLISLLQPAASWAQPGNPNAGPGGPILVVHSNANKFGLYTAEVLRAEGLNEFAVQEIGSVTASVLSNYDVVILGQMTLSSAQVTLFTNFVNSGGVLIAFRPPTNIYSLFGLSFSGGTRTNQYLSITTSSGPGAGIVGQTIQYKGTADRATISSGSGATTIARIFSTATSSTSNVGVTSRNVGSNGGKAIAFLFDLNTSIIQTRQGNPAWVGQDRDGVGGIRTNDLFFGGGWIDFNRAQIPNADELQRLLANIVLQSNSHRKPLPRFWYLPGEHKAAVIMAGDDHGSGGTVERFNHLKRLSPSNTPEAVENWEAYRATVFTYPATVMTNAQATAFSNEGFDIGIHLNTGCANYTPATLAAELPAQLAQISAQFPTIPQVISNRTHCAIWPDWDSKPRTEVLNGIRINTDYYYWPASWVQNRPGLFTGSGFPMRMTDLDGDIIDNYQLTTQITDESGQNIPLHLRTLLDNALGSNGYYGTFCLNLHHDFGNGYFPDVDSVIKEAQLRNVPLISARQLLTWLDGRNQSSFGNFTWTANTLNFSITAASGSKNLKAMLPRITGATNNLRLQTITRNGSPVTINYRTIKGMTYAFFDALPGTYVANYGTVVCAPPAATLAVVPATGCATGPLQLQLASAGGTGPYTVQVNGVTYENVSVGTPFLNTNANEVTLWNTLPALIKPNETDGNQPVELGMKFRSSVAGYVTGVQFFKGDLSTGAHVGKLYTASGTLLASVTFTNTNNSGSGWRQARFSSPVYIQPNTTYVVSYFSPSGYFAYTDFFFNSAFNRGPLTALANGTDGPNGLGGYGSGFPTLSFQSRNYWVDVLFVPETGVPATSSFTLTSITDRNGCTNTGTNLSTASFTQNPLPRGTVTLSTPNICSGSPIRLVFNAAAGRGPYQLTINGTTYTGVVSGTSFATGINASPAVTLQLTNITDANGCSTTGTTTIPVTITACGPLPVDLINFKAAAVQNNVKLSWTTTYEDNNKGFDVQRSKDGINWESIGFVRGAGSSTAPLNYSFTDPALSAGKYNYRLIQVDFDGRSKASPVETVTINGKLEYVLKQNFPNPFQGMTTIEFSMARAGQVTLSVMDINGRVISTIISERRAQGFHQVQFRSGALAAGTYYLRMETEDFRTTRKMVIQ